jgi:hypothetical protein
VHALGSEYHGNEANMALYLFYTHKFCHIVPDSADNLPWHSAILPGEIELKLFCHPHYLQNKAGIHYEAQGKLIASIALAIRNTKCPFKSVFYSF